MSQPSSLRIVRRQVPSPLQIQAPSSPSLSSSRNSRSARTPSLETSLGNKLQRLAFLSPRHVQDLERLVDHILKSVEHDGRGLYLLLLLASIAA